MTKTVELIIDTNAKKLVHNLYRVVDSTKCNVIKQ